MPGEVIGNTKMQVKGLTCTLNMPPALKSKKEKEKEIKHELPPYYEISAFEVNDYAECDPTWMHGSAKASSYFVGVDGDRGLWLDFTENESHTHDVAVVISIQGINPVTMQKMVGKNPLRLEQYKEKCPKHKVEFENEERYCPKCKYKWPAQNYIATTTGQRLWLDGFFTPDGIRQYLLTEDERRGVASQTIKKERVFAIGVAFYLSKKPKEQTYPSWNTENYQHDVILDPESFCPKPKTWGTPPWGLPQSTPNWNGWNYKFPPSNSIHPSVKINENQKGMSGGSHSVNSTSGDPVQMPPFVFPCIDLDGANDTINPQGFPPDDAHSLHQLSSGGANLDVFYSTQVGPDGKECSLEMGAMSDSTIPSNTPVRGVLNQNGPNKNSRMYKKPGSYAVEKKLYEVAAGALIDQEIGVDPNPIDYWESKAAGIIYINYTNTEHALSIVNAGKIVREEKSEGALDGLVVGN